MLEKRMVCMPAGLIDVCFEGGFYKNLSIMGGFLLVYITGAGKYSIEVLCSIAAP